MNKELNKVELKIFGAGGRYIYIDALDKDSIIEIYNNLDKGEVVKELARLSWDYADSIKGIAVCRINLKDGAVFYDIIKSGSSDMYPDIYPVIASVPVDFNTIDDDSDYKAYEDSLFTDYVFNDNFSDIINEIYEKGMQL